MRPYSDHAHMPDYELMEYPLGFSDLLDDEKQIITLFRVWRDQDNDKREFEKSISEQLADMAIFPVLPDLFAAFGWIKANGVDIIKPNLRDLGYQVQRECTSILSEEEEFVLACLATRSAIEADAPNGKIYSTFQLQRCRNFFERMKMLIRCPSCIDRSGRDHLLRRISDSYQILRVVPNATNDAKA